MRLSWRMYVSAVLIVALPCLGLADVVGGPGDSTWAGDYGGSAGAPGTTIIPDVPSYIWYHGCGPTAAGMIVGYWDAHGFPDLIPGSNDWNTNRQAIKDMIASPGHIRDYAPTPDRTATADDPYHPDDSVADFNYSSRYPDQHGWSYFSYQDDGLRNYAAYRGYTASTAYNVRYWSLWDPFVAAIDDNHPVEFLVDTDGNGSTDHFVTAIGYYDVPGSEMYACYDTWSHNVRWFSYKPTGNTWGVYGGTLFNPAEPEPVAVVIDIKPTSDPNSINLSSRGIVPVAVLGSYTFDVQDLDLQSVEFSGSEPKERGESGKLGSFEDINTDSFLDLILLFPTGDLQLQEGVGEGTLTGVMNDGTEITGADTVRVVENAAMGDCNLDGVVNVGDLAVFGYHYGFEDRSWTEGDFNGDGIVDIGDLGVMGANYGRDSGDGGGAGVPEPTTMSLLGLGALAMLRRRK